MGSTYEIRVDGETKAEGNMKDDWSFEKPKKIKDPEQSKPEDWVDDEEIDDPNDKKPDDWDDEPANIPDPDATEPDDWDDEEDGEWQAPQIDNPDYKGEWKAKKIPNPDYKGPWVHPEIDNPDYVEAKDVYKRGPIGYIGVEVWHFWILVKQMKMRKRRQKKHMKRQINLQKKKKMMKVKTQQKMMKDMMSCKL